MLDTYLIRKAKNNFVKKSHVLGDGVFQYIESYTYIIGFSWIIEL